MCIPPPTPPPDTPDSPANPWLDDETVGRALLSGLCAHDPVTPRVSLATVRALRRAERSHVERVTAAVHACLDHAGRTGTRSMDERILADLAPFERGAAATLLARHRATCEQAAEAPDGSRVDSNEPGAQQSVSGPPCPPVPPTPRPRRVGRRVLR